MALRHYAVDPGPRPGAATGDKAYSSAANRAYLRKRGITAVIPVKEDQKANRRNRGRAGGRPPAFDAGRYKERNTVERCPAAPRRPPGPAPRTWPHRHRAARTPAAPHPAPPAR